MGRDKKRKEREREMENEMDFATKRGGGGREGSREKSSIYTQEEKKEGKQGMPTAAALQRISLRAGGKVQKFL